MQKQIESAIELLKKQDINGCITGSCLLNYFEGQDVDIFTYDKNSFTKLLFFMHYNPLFQILDPLEKHKFDSYINEDNSSLKSIGLITIKFKYNLCVDVNIVFKSFFKNIFDVISSFDLDIISIGYDIKTKKTLSLRETTGMVGTWNTWNTNFYNHTNFWSCKRLLRQFERVVKYTNRGYDVSTLTDKYIELVESILNVDNFYKTEKGTDYFNNNINEFKIVLQILKIWKRDLVLTDEQLLLLKTLI